MDAFLFFPLTVKNFSSPDQFPKMKTINYLLMLPSKIIRLTVPPARSVRHISNA